MPKQRKRDEDDRAQLPNPQGSVYEESGYPEEHSARHGVGRRDDDDDAAAAIPAPPAGNATIGSTTGQEAGYRQREEQQAYRRGAP